MRSSAILDKDLEELIKHTKGAFLNHYEKYSKDKLEIAHKEAADTVSIIIIYYTPASL